MSGKRSRDKGKRGELELAHWLEERGVDAFRGQQHRGGPDSPDVRCSLPGIHLEVKRTEALRLYLALEQATAEAPEGCVPVVLHRTNHRRWVAILSAEDWLALVKGAQHGP